MRRGFTLIELLAVVGIIGMLAGLLLPAVQAAREAARRVQCRNNLRQIGLAMHQYHEARDVLPFGQGYEPGGRWNGWSSLALMLPYLEQAPLYDSINFAIEGGSDPATVQNTSALRTTVAGFLCPSDIDRLGGPEGHNNYFGNSGSDPFGSGGLFLINVNATGTAATPAVPQTVAFRDVLDGLSSTAAFAERVKGTGVFNNGRDDSGPVPVPNDTLRPSALVYAVPGLPMDGADAYAACRSASVAGPVASAAGEYSVGSMWAVGAWWGARYNHVMPPDTWSCTAFNTDWSGAHTAGSRHGGSVNVLLADGAVRAVRPSIAPAAWWALGTRAGGEISSDGGF